ncbi:MAG: class I SAM-dependent methyltransferase [Myxococcales bacterium]|nr:class I SAM-dependent methyltransferase [Myxococcales bacterium]
MAAEKDELEPGAVQHYDDALYYDYTYRTRTEDIGFYRRFVRQHGGPVLELGAGSGRVTIPLVQDGAEVCALEASPAMLARADEKSRELLEPKDRKRLTLVQSDMRDFSLDRTFNLVLAPFNTLLHLYEPGDFARCFRSVAKHLGPNGRFVFDVRVPQLKELARDPDRVYRVRPFKHPTLGHKVEYEEQFHYDPIKQVQHVTIRFKPGPGAPRRAKAVEVLLSQRQIFPNELRALLALGGLELAGRYGDFSGRPLAEDDLVQIIVARKSSPPTIG